MIQLGNIAENNYVLGEYENGFTLYNDIVPVLDTYENLKQYMEEDTSLLYFDYSDKYDSSQRYFFDDTLFADSDYTVTLMAQFPRAYQTFGKKRDMALYRIVLKHEAVELYRANFDNLNPIQRIELAHLQFEHGAYQPGAVFGKEPSNPYPDLYGDQIGDIRTDIYVNVDGNIYGDIIANIYGDVHGDIYGNIYGEIYGKIYGKIYGMDFSQEKGIAK